MYKQGLMMIILMTVMSCSDVEELALDVELEEYINVFIAEGAARGVEVDPDNADLRAYITEIDQRNVVGQCYSYSDDSREIIIDRSYWSRINDLEKEYVIMHELGHCLLNRDHNNESDFRGDCLSIMQSGTGLCSRNYNPQSRERLLDELFNF